MIIILIRKWQTRQWVSSTQYIRLYYTLTTFVSIPIAVWSDIIPLGRKITSLHIKISMPFLIDYNSGNQSLCPTQPDMYLLLSSQCGLNILWMTQSETNLDYKPRINRRSQVYALRIASHQREGNMTQRVGSETFIKYISARRVWCMWSCLLYQVTWHTQSTFLVGLSAREGLAYETTFLVHSMNWHHKREHT